MTYIWYKAEYKPGRCWSSYFIEVTKEGVGFGRVVANTDTHIVVDWYEYPDDELRSQQEVPKDQIQYLGDGHG